MRKQVHKKLTSLTVAIVMLFTLFAPVAAQASSYFFTLDDSALSLSRDIASQINDATNGINARAADIKKVTSDQLTITGSYQGITASSIGVTVQQLYKDMSATPLWQKDTGHIASFSVVTNSVTPTFSVSNMKLFSGYNLITFSGMQGAAQQAESFLVYYNDAPILNSLKVGTSTTSPVPLNEGASIVANSPSVYFQGSATNGTTISVGGQVSSIQGDGSFYTPSLQLNAGKNDLTIILKNDTNSLTISRTIYYYDPTNPFLSVTMDVGSQTGFDLLHSTPNVTDNTATPSGVMHVQMLVPYSSASFLSGATVQVNGLATTISGSSNSPADDKAIVGPNGTSYDYELVDFKTAAITGFIANTSQQQQTVTMHVYYNQSFDAQYRYNYIPGQISLDSLQLLNGPVPAVGTDFDLLSLDSSGGKQFTLQPLNNSSITTDTFYVVATTDSAIDPNDTTTNQLIASLLPLSSSNLTVTPVGGVDRTSNAGIANVTSTSPKRIQKETVWKVTGLPSGSQQIQFQLDHSGTLMNKVTVTVNYVSTTGISLDDLYDGEIITINTSVNSTPTLSFKGSFVGFPYSVAQTDVNFYVNNQLSNKLVVDSTNNKLTVTGLGISNSGPLTPGQNSLLIVTNYLHAGVQRTIQKSLKIYIVDAYTSSIQNAQPTLPSNRVWANYSSASSLPNDSQAFMSTSTSIETSGSKFISHIKTYDLTLKGTGADAVAITMNGTQVFNTSYAIPDSPGASQVGGSTQISGVSFSFVGSKSQFYMRLENLTFTTSQPTQVFNITLTTASGSQSTQSVEVDFQNNSYSILAPLANQGGDIVVNKNFVTVDIQADGASAITINNQAGVLTQETPSTVPHFIAQVTGLKAGKDNTIAYKITWSGGAAPTSGSLIVHYSGVSTPGAQDMEPMATKFSVFNKGLQLTFPSGTTLKTYNPTNDVTRFYNHDLLFGIADPKDAVVQRQDDYGNILTANGYLYGPFSSNSVTQNFTTISPIYWTSGGVGDGTSAQPDLNGIDPYNVNGTFITYDENRKLVPTNRGTLTLGFNDAVVQEAQTTITVFYFNDKLQWTNLGGTVNAANHTITVPFEDFGYYMVAKIKGAPQDITNHAWARNVLQALYAKGIMQSLYTNLFSTDENATRGELATILVKALNLPLNYDNNNTFLDVIPNSGNAKWDYAHVETAARAGIVTGYDNQVFNPEWPLTREDAAVMIARASELKLALNDSKLMATLNKGFTDTSDMNYYALSSIAAVFSKGIMVGVDNAVAPGQKQTQSFKPKADLTRAELGQIAVRLMQKITKTLPANLN